MWLTDCTQAELSSGRKQSGWNEYWRVMQDWARATVGRQCDQHQRRKYGQKSQAKGMQ